MDENLFDNVGSLLTKDPGRAMHQLFEGLQALKLNGGSEESWNGICDKFLGHPIRELIFSDPMTRRSFEKPRGYAGDAVLLDYIYGYQKPTSADIGSEVYNFAVSRPAALAVRERLGILRRILQSCKGRVLSVACGHLREAEELTNPEVELTGLDSDVESLQVVARNVPVATTVCNSVRSLLSGSANLGSFDLIYSAGLYDYLQDRVARALTHRLVGYLRPGGKLFVSNFLPTTRDIGYMECCMGWKLLYRGVADMNELVSEVPVADIANTKTWQSDTEALGYLELTKS